MRIYRTQLRTAGGMTQSIGATGAPARPPGVAATAALSPPTRFTTMLAQSQPSLTFDVGKDQPTREQQREKELQKMGRFLEVQEAGQRQAQQNAELLRKRLNEKEKKQRKAETLLKEAKRRTEAKFDARNEARKAKLRHKELERAEIGSDAFASYKEHVAELQAKAQE